MSIPTTPTVPTRRARPTMALALLLAATACQGSEPEVEVEPGEVDPTGTEVAVRIDTTAEALHAHLQEEDWREAWALWPGLEPFYAGDDPHGMLLTTRVNEAASRGIEAMRAGDADDLPFGAVVVKENFTPDSALAALTVMYKREGYDPEHNDWFWMKRLADGTVEAAGRVESCIECHGRRAADQDYLTSFRSVSGG